MSTGVGRVALSSGEVVTACSTDDALVVVAIYPAVSDEQPALEVAMTAAEAELLGATVVLAAVSAFGKRPSTPRPPSEGGAR